MFDLWFEAKLLLVLALWLTLGVIYLMTRKKKTYLNDAANDRVRDTATDFVAVLLMLLQFNMPRTSNKSLKFAVWTARIIVIASFIEGVLQLFLQKS